MSTMPLCHIGLDQNLMTKPNKKKKYSLKIFLIPVDLIVFLHPSTVLWICKSVRRGHHQVLGQ